MVFSEGGGDEALAVFVGEGEVTEVGEVSGFLWLNIWGEEVVDAAGPFVDPCSGLAVVVAFHGAIAIPSQGVVAVWDGALHTEAGEVSDVTFGGDAGFDVDDSICTDVVSE